jgi:hypothetical protein
MFTRTAPGVGKNARNTSGSLDVDPSDNASASANQLIQSVPTGRSFCCYILTSSRWPTPYTGKTCDLKGRLHRHNHPSPRSRAYTKGKGTRPLLLQLVTPFIYTDISLSLGPWRVAAAVFGLCTNRQSVCLERALKRHAKHRARPAGFNNTQTAVLDAVRVASRPDLWLPRTISAATNANAAPPGVLHLHVFRDALAPPPATCHGTPYHATSCNFERTLLGAVARARPMTAGAAVYDHPVVVSHNYSPRACLQVHCHRQCDYTP